MKNFYLILNKSSIHGLPYLTSRHHGPIGRLVWLLCVLVSFSLAGLVIWKNVYTWQAQPTVVSSVEYALVEGQPWLPQVVACPNSLNALAMLTGLLKAKYHEVLTPKWMFEFKVLLAKIKIMDDYYLSSRKRINLHKISTLDLAPYESCFDLQEGTSGGCKLINVLAVLLDMFGFNKAQEIIVTFAAESFVNPGKKDISEYLSMRHNVTILDNNAVNASSLTIPFGVFSLYKTFYTVLNETNDQLMKPQPLSTYIENMSSIDFPEESELGLFFSWFLNGFSSVQYQKVIKHQYDPIQELSDIMAVIWLDALKLYLDVESHQEAISLVNSYWPDGLQSSLFQPPWQRKNDGYLCAFTLLIKEKVDSFRNVCDTHNNVKQKCPEYCHMIAKINSETQNKVKEVFNMGLDDISPPFGAFQSCQHPTMGNFHNKDCWKRVINDKGVCYSSGGNGALTNVVHGAMEDVPIRFLFDGGRHVEILEKTPGDYTMGTLPADINKRKLDVHVVPYHQNSVQDMLMESVKKYGDELPIVVSYDPHDLVQLYKGTAKIQWAFAHIKYVHNSTKAFKSMNPSQRNCYLPKNEKELKHFGKYSEADCMLECAWGVGKEICDCIPWYLVDKIPNYQMCEIFGNRCFAEIVASRYKTGSLVKEQCQSNCLLNCDMVQYNIAKVWHKGTYTLEKIDADLVNGYHSLKANEIPYEVLTLADNNTNRFLKMGNVFALELRLSNSKLAQKIVRTATMTTTDLISNIGGTLGLFCGLSVLSLVEVVYWTGKAFWGYVSKRGQGQEKKNVRMK